MSKKVLFVTYGGGHIAMVLPVIRAVRALDPSVECVLLALTTGHRRAQTEGMQALGYKDFLHLVDSDKALEWGAQLHRHNQSPDVSDEESQAYLGINYLDLVAQHGAEGAATLYAEKGRYAFLPLRFMQRLIEHVAPDAVVATNSPRSEEAALRVAINMGIPSIALVDLFGLDSDPFVLRNVKPDWTCVLAESVRERLVAQAFSADSVKVTGNPAFDGLIAPSVHAQASEFLTRQGWQKRQVILYIGAWESVAHPATDIPSGRSFPIEIEGILRQYVSNRPQTALIVRYHPGDWFQYPRLADTPQIYFSEPPAQHIHPLVLASNVVVNTNSTVGLEAAVAGKPVISVENSPSVHHWFSLAKLGISYPSPTQHDLGATLDNVLAHGQARSGFKTDGQAARRVAIVVADALHGQA
jgi:hypothetical protein